jgi:predicted metal-dependent hydrolase
VTWSAARGGGGQIELPFGDASPTSGGTDDARDRGGAAPRGAGPSASGGEVMLGSDEPAVCFVRHRRARRYVLRLAPDGTPRVTIPRGGSRREAEAFLRRSTDWLQRERRRLEDRRERERRAWTAGAKVLFRGLPVEIGIAGGGQSAVQLGAARIPLGRGQSIRDVLRRYLRRLASIEIPPRVRELASETGRDVRSVTIRDQRSRWGSCSPAGTISLNWRLVQMPPEVADYIIHHELAHLEHANHSRRFWRLVRRVCPYTDAARTWLRRHGSELL